MIKKSFSIALVGLLLVGCAQKSEDIKASHVSTLKYSKYSCSQIKREILTVNSKLRKISAKQDETSSKDAVAMGVGLVLFAPALLLLAAGDDEKAEIANLKGEYEALKKNAIRKKCRYAAELQ